jgi:hypothetical protein
MLIPICSKSSQSQSHFATDGQSVSMSWCRAQIWDFWPEILLFFFFLKVSVLSFFGAPSLTRGRVCHVSVLSLKSTVVSQYFLYTAVVFKSQWTSRLGEGIPGIPVWEPPTWVILGTCPLLRKGLLISFHGNQQYVTTQTTISGTMLYNCYSFNSTCSIPHFYGVQSFIIISKDPI